MKRGLFKDHLDIPYETVGGVRHYQGYLGYGCEYIKNFIFSDELQFRNFTRGWSSVKAIYISTITGNIYEMFLSDFEAIINNTGKSVRNVNGEFCFRKQGRNYGVVLLDENI